jgi:hypothetical protein
MTMRYYQGLFRPDHPEKYVGDATKIQYRSSWELKFMRWADRHPDVIHWASEEIAIPYVSPIDKQVHRYFPDFLIRYRNKQGVFRSAIVEIKPLKHVKEPVIKKGMHKRRMIQEVATYAVNQAKWKAAQAYAQKAGMDFNVLTEQELGIK